MTQSKWRRIFAAALVTTLLVTSLAPAAFAAEQAAPAFQVSAKEVTGTITGGQFAKIWLGLVPENPGTVTVSAEWDRANPEENGLGFFLLNEANLAAVVAGQPIRDNNVGSGSTNFFLNGPDNLQGASFRATGPAYTVVVYNDSANDANFKLSVDNGVLIDESDQVQAVGGVTEEATEEAAAEETATEAAEAAATEAATVAATPVATETTAAATPAAVTTVVASGPYRGSSVEGELNEQYAQHYLGLEPTQRDGDINLRLTFDPQDNQELARRLSFWVLDDQGFKRYQAGENAGDVAVAAGNRVTTPGEENVRSASFTSSGFGPYTVIVYNNSRVPATYNLSVTGGLLVDDSLQTITAQESTTGTVTVAATTAPAAATGATTTTTGAATTTTTAAAGTGRAGEPGGTYTVQSGDTLALIARDIYGDYRLFEELCAFNNIADCNVIEVGQVINLPTNDQIGATGTTTAAATPAATTAATPAATTAAVTTTAATTSTTGTTSAVTTTAPVTSTGTTTSTTGTARPTTGTTAAAGTIAEVAASNPNFSILAQALEATGLDATLSSGEYTVFAPTDAAFNDLLATTKLTADQLLQADELAQILQYHVLSGEVLAEDVTNGMRATTVQGQPVTFEVRDGSVYINGAKVTITDIPASNGVIHAISAVILPPAQ